jgi:beta-lactamase regulating signal transducer with metallopeptidase domain
VTASLVLPEVAGVAALLLRATLLMGAAWAAAAVLRTAGASAAARHLAWLLGIAALLALPFLWGLAPDLRLPVLPAEAAPPPALAGPPPPLDLTGPVSPEVAVDSGWSLLLLAAYLLGAAALLLRLVVGRRMLKRLWSEASTATDPAWNALLSRLCCRMGLSRRVELRISKGPAVPMTWGTLAPKLLLPAEASEWPPERRRLVLLHELAHVARRDSFSRSLASLACALYWFHPGAWLAARQLRLEQEHAADDHVLMSGGSPRTYASSLLHLAGGPGARPRFDQAAAMAGMYQLERRLLSITGAARRDRPGPLFRSSSALLAGVTTVVVAAGVPVRATPTLPGPFAADRSVGSPGGKGAAPAPAEASSTRRAETASVPPPGRANGSGRSAREIAADPQSRRDGAASEAREIAAGRGVAGVSEGIRPGRADDRDRRQAGADAQPIQDFGWELSRRDLQVQAGSRDPSQPARITLPARIYSEPRDRSGPPAWARNVPRLVRGRPPTGSTQSASQGPLVLSWSLEVGGK